MDVAWEALGPTTSQSHHQLAWNQLAGTGGRLLQVPLHSPNRLYSNQGNNRPVEARFCSLSVINVRWWRITLPHSCQRNSSLMLLRAWNYPPYAYCERSYHVQLTDMKTAYRSAICPRYRTNEDADPEEMPSGLAITRYDSHWGRYTHERCITTTAPTSDGRHRKQRNGRLFNVDQFGMHISRRSERMRWTHIPTGQDASG